MADKVTVQPTPIQRNRYDVAMELTKIHVNMKTSDEDLSTVFSKYYALIQNLHNTDNHTLKQFLPEEIKSKLK